MVPLSRPKGLLPAHFFVSIIFFLMICCLPRVQAGVMENPEQISWHISARSVTFDNKRSLYIAEDEVVITGGKTRLEADYVEFSNKTKDAFAQGHVLLISGEDSITCNAMRINLATETGTISRGNIFIQKNNFYITGENIKKTGRFAYSADRGSITSCPGDVPDWKISGKRIRVTLDGYGTARHTVLWARKAPVLYSPYLVFPVKTKRQTGFLLPRIATSDRKGFEYEQPFFWAINRSSDATFYVDTMADRGTKAGAEYRYVIDKRSKGAVMIDGLDDDTVDDGTTATENYRFDATPRRTNTNRYWFRMKNNQQLPDGFTAKLDIDLVSDEDYLHEFQDGFTGYNRTRDYFEDEFGRSLDEYDDYTRKNSLTLTRSWANYSFRMNTLWYDNVRARRQGTDDTSLQTLPSFQFDASKKQIGSSRLYYTLDSEYAAFYRKDTTTTLVKGQRTDIHPRLYLPLKLGPYFNFEPSVGARETLYHTTDFTDVEGDDDDFRSREMYDLQATLSTKIIRMFEPRARFADKLKHEIVPELKYQFIPNVSQATLPYFDDQDRVDPENEIALSVTNTFISKRTLTGPDGREKTVYRDLAYIKLSQGFDIRRERKGQSQPFSNLELEAELDPCDYLDLTADVAWNPHDSHFKTVNLGGTVKDRRGDKLTGEYRYSSTLSHTLYGRLDVAITDRLSTFYSLERNLSEERTVETRAGISYDKACWRLDLYVEESGGEKSVAFMINLAGIGEFGNQ